MKNKIAVYNAVAFFAKWSQTFTSKAAFFRVTFTPVPQGIIKKISVYQRGNYAVLSQITDLNNAYSIGIEYQKSVRVNTDKGSFHGNGDSVFINSPITFLSIDLFFQNATTNVNAANVAAFQADEIYLISPVNNELPVTIVVEYE